jgi:thiol peroxidase
MVLSDHMRAEFGEKYGALIKERRTLRRAVFVVGRDDKLAYVAYMPSSSEEPNYAEVIEAAKKALS